MQHFILREQLSAQKNFGTIKFCFDEKEFEILGMSGEDIFEERMRIEKDYLRKFCSERGIEFYESDPGSEKIFNIPRTQRDL